VKTFLIIKPTEHNKKILRKRGLFSDDFSYFFKCFEDIMEDREYRLEIRGISSDNSLVDEFLDSGLNLKF
jgi:hypothetical protein